MRSFHTFQFHFCLYISFWKLRGGPCPGDVVIFVDELMGNFVRCGAQSGQASIDGIYHHGLAAFTCYVGWYHHTSIVDCRTQRNISLLVGRCQVIFAADFMDFCCDLAVSLALWKFQHLTLRNCWKTKKWNSFTGSFSRSTDMSCCLGALSTFFAFSFEGPPSGDACFSNPEEELCKSRQWFTWVKARCWDVSVMRLGVPSSIESQHLRLQGKLGFWNSLYSFV